MYQKLTSKQAFFLISLFFLVLSVHGKEERILSFKSFITVIQDQGLVRVQEKIRFFVTGQTIKHGIIRSMPTRYFDRLGTRKNVDCSFKKILFDGEPIEYRVDATPTGKEVRIGNSKVFVAPGEHTYALDYTVSRSVGFFKEHDELYWNVTGNDWSFVIDHVEAHVDLPKGIARENIEIEGYTGFLGQKKQLYQVDVREDSYVCVHSTQSLLPGQGLTIVVSWPKGFVRGPSLLYQLYLFLKDNILFFWLSFSFIVQFLIASYFWSLNRKKMLQTIKTVVPRFHPPKNMTAAEVFYIMNGRYTSKATAIELIDCAVKGFVTFRYTKKFFKDIYTICARNNQDSKDSKQEAYSKKKLSLFWKRGSCVELSSKNASLVRSFVQIMKRDMIGLDLEYFDVKRRRIKDFLLALTPAFFGLSGLLHMDFVLLSDVYIPVFILFFIMSMLLFVVSQKYIVLYSKQGYEMKALLEGFKLFLMTTERDRLQSVGTPPDQTPQLYEKYLPYAIAFGVEKQWTKQFGSVFARLEQVGKAYSPSWYYGGTLYHFHVYSFAANFHNSLGKVISYSTRPTASSTNYSARSGGGFSGGGGGGGGGRGW
jgi:hypothetical protein